MNSEPEFTTVESPFINQLIGMSWKLVTASLDQPSVTGRETSRGVQIKSNLRKAIQRINMHDGQPWIDECRIWHAVGAPEGAKVPKPGAMHRGVVEKLLGHRVQLTPFLTESAA